MSGTPLTKPLHNVSVQTGTGVSCMGSRRGSTGFTAVRSLSWPLGLAVGVGAFFAIRVGVPWLLSHQSGPIAQGFNQGISAVLAPIAWVVFAMCCMVALASFVGSYQRRKLVETRTTLGSPAAKAWRQFELVVGETFRRRGYAMEENRHGRCRPHQSDLAQRRLPHPGAIHKSVNVRKVAVSAKRKLYILLAHPTLRVRFKISWDKSMSN